MQAELLPPLTYQIEQLAEGFRQRKPVRTGSFVITLFGDAIAPRGGEVSLGTLIDVLDGLGIGHRLVRTAVYRLVQDGVLANEQVGRRSFYRLTGDGQRATAEASQRIYASDSPAWDGQWHLVLLSAVPSAQRPALRKALTWLGYGTFGSDMLAHPHPDDDAVDHELNGLDGGAMVVKLSGESTSGSMAGFNTLIRSAWQLNDLEKGYRDFIERFSPIVDCAGTLAPVDAFYARAFLIHEYRRVLLRDPGLADDFLPDDWHGQAARSLTRNLYRMLHTASEAFIDTHFVNRHGALPAPIPSLANRFS